MVSLPIRKMLRALRSPTGAGVAVPELGDAVAHVYAISAMFGLVLLIGENIVGSVGIVDAALVAAAVIAALIARIPALRVSALASNVLVGTNTALVAGAIWAHPIAGGGLEMSVLAMLFIWPLLLACYFLPLRLASLHVVWVGVAYVGALAASVQIGEATVRIGLLLAVFGTVAPIVAMVRVRAQLSALYLRDAAIRDPLTALLNRRGFDDALDEQLDQAVAAATDLTLLLGDVDYFKAINDQHGHRAGDDVLSEVATLIQLECEGIAVPAVIGGGEFAIIFPGAGPADGLAIAERVRAAVEHQFSSSATYVTISIGIASRAVHGNDADQLVRAADQALFAAKELGRNRTVEYTDDVVGILERARLVREDQSRSHMATLVMLAEALDMREKSTARHSRTVAEYSEAMAQELGLDEALVERLSLAGLLHDIGKIGIPDSVLLKPAKLTDEEWELMRQHPEIGARMLNHRDYIDIRDWVLAHHERPDGRGYPFGLAGDEIPLGARILSVADAYEAMTADRVYRAAPGHVFARGELRACSGKQFDPEVVAAMERVLDRLQLGREDEGDDDITALSEAA